MIPFTDDQDGPDVIIGMVTNVVAWSPTFATKQLMEELSTNDVVASVRMSAAAACPC